MMSLKAIAHELGGEVTAGGVSAPGAGHSKQDRSLRVFLDPADPDGFRTDSFAGDNFRVCRDYVKARLGLTESAWVSRPHAPAPPRSPPTSTDDNASRRVVVMFRDAEPARGSIVETYLAGRGLGLPPDDLRVLRFDPRHLFRLKDGTKVSLPAMLALFRDIRTNKAAAIHRTALKPDGSGKFELPDGSDLRKMLGPVRGAAIKLDEDASVELGLVIGEGIETCLAARQLGFQPCWAVGSAGGIQTFPVLSGIEAITLLREDDKTGANARAVAACSERWLAAGREVLIVKPIDGGDANDALRKLRS